MNGRDRVARAAVVQRQGEPGADGERILACDAALAERSECGADVAVDAQLHELAPQFRQ